ncbi:hypothetical protein BGX33_007795 [Mortierella sp. NVP41]|nr:hypothetical protein BGX33_007795 [Mortierella sp. NVP41]
MSAKDRHNRRYRDPPGARIDYPQGKPKKIDIKHSTGVEEELDSDGCFSAGCWAMVPELEPAKERELARKHPLFKP